MTEATRMGTSRRRNVGKLLTRLQPRAPSLVPRKGSDGHREPWDIEDGVTIAGALGAVAARSPGYAFAVTVLCLRWWPDYVFGPEVVKIKGVEKVEVRLPGSKDRSRGRTEPNAEPPTVMRTALVESRARTFRPAMVPLVHFANLAFRRKLAWEAMPAPLAARVLAALNGGELVTALIDEYVNPSFCMHCGGHGQALITKDREGNPVPAHIGDCPACLGAAVAPWGVGRRARAVGMRTADFHKHVQPAYGTVLGIFRQLESRAARALVRVLGD